MITDTAHAKIGRSMKKCAILTGRCPGPQRGSPRPLAPMRAAAGISSLLFSPRETPDGNALISPGLRVHFAARRARAARR